MNGTVKVTGGKRLVGEVIPVPNKNAILAAIPASILTNQPFVYKDVPKSTDVEKMLEMLKLLGAKIDDSDFSSITIDCSSLNSCKIDKELGIQIRASIMFVGPLLTRFQRAEIPLPGGCALGARSIAAHIDVFTKAGVEISYEDDYVVFTSPKKVLSNYFIWQVEASVTATENIAMYAAGTDSKFTIIDAACEPHVSELLETLSKMGAEVFGIGSNKLEIIGSKDLRAVSYKAGPDIVDICGYITAAALTDGEIKIKGANVPNLVGGVSQWFSKFNVSIAPSGDDLIIKRNGPLKIDAVNSGFPVAGRNLLKFYPRPWPGFPVDCLPVIVALACKTEGRLLITNWMYETGLDFVRELNTMGADIFIAGPERVIVHGPVTFKNAEIYSPKVIQACKAIFLASLCDEAETTIHGVDILKRRYPNIFETYKKLGAKIEIL